MADKKISALTALIQANVDTTNDVLPIVDTNATETKKVTPAALVGAAAAAGLTNVDINSGTIDGVTIATSDITVGATKTLDVSAGTLTLANDQISGDKVEGGTINAVTINTLTSTAVNATTLDATNLEVTNLKAKDGTAAGSIADSTGVVTIGSSVLTTTDINGGTIDGTTIATSDITVGSGKTLNVSGGTLTLANDQISGDSVEGGTINAITINTLGGTTANVTTVNATTVDATNVEVTNVKAKDGTAAITIADSTGNVRLLNYVGVGNNADSTTSGFNNGRFGTNPIAYGIHAYNTVPATATTIANLFHTWMSTASNGGTPYTLPSVSHYRTQQVTINADSTITNQYGFFADNTLTGATNNFGFYSNIASGTNRWNFYANGTAASFFSGSVGVGTFAEANQKLSVGGTYPTSANVSIGVISYGTIPSGSTNSGEGFRSQISTQAASFTVTNFRHFYANQGTIGAGSTATNQFGYVAESSLTGATNNYGFYSNIATGSGRYNFFANGSAPNYFAGNVGIGLTSPTKPLSVYANDTTTTQVVIEQDSTGDSGIQFSLTGTKNWTIGVDNSDGDRFKIENGNIIGSSNDFVIDSSGNVGIGGTAAASVKFQILGTYPSSGTATYVSLLNGTVPSGSTAAAVGYYSALNTQAASFTVGNLRHFQAEQGTIGSGSAITTQVGYYVDSTLTGATNNYGFYSNIASGSGRWNLYCAGTAENYVANNLKIGGTAARATTAGTNQLVLFDGTAPVGTLANGVSFYSSSGEANVMDAAGNATLLSPHDSETNEWIFRSKHTPTGKVLKIDVEKMLRFINGHFGLDMVHEFTE